MGILRSTVIMKTDIKDWTVRSAGSTSVSLSALLAEHKAFINSIITKHEGSVIKGEGDSFWIVFPSVTGAALAAIQIQENLAEQQMSTTSSERLSVRITITLGDVVHQEDDIFGSAVNLAARIEAVTPQDNIYLSHAAWLTLNRSEIETAYVDDFPVKGFADPEKVYRIVRTHKKGVVKDQIIAFTDQRGFMTFVKDAPHDPPRHNSCRFHRTKKPGAAKKERSWHDTDKHSRSGRLLGCCRLKARQWSW